MKRTAYLLLACLALPAFAGQGLDEVLTERFRTFAEVDAGAPARDVGEEWFLYRRMLRLSLSGQISVGVAKVDVTPEVEFIQER